VLAFREQLVEKNAAPKTINRRISSLSSFYKYLAAAAAEMRLPITVPNPAHAAVHLARVHRHRTWWPSAPAAFLIAAQELAPAI